MRLFGIAPAVVIALALAQVRAPARTGRGKADAGDRPVLLGTDPPGRLRPASADAGTDGGTRDAGPDEVHRELERLRTRLDALEQDRVRAAEQTAQQLQQLSAEVQNSDLHLFEAPPAHLTSMFSRYGRSGGWSAPNRPAGVLINYYVKQSIESRKTAESQPQLPPVKILITAPDGQTVRTLHGPGRAGVNRIAWDLRWDPPTSLRTGRGESDNEGGGESGEEAGGDDGVGPPQRLRRQWVQRTGGHDDDRKDEERVVGQQRGLPRTGGRLAGNGSVAGPGGS